MTFFFLWMLLGFISSMIFDLAVYTIREMRDARRMIV